MFIEQGNQKSEIQGPRHGTIKAHSSIALQSLLATEIGAGYVWAPEGESTLGSEGPLDPCPQLDSIFRARQDLRILGSLRTVPHRNIPRIEYIPRVRKNRHSS